MLILFASEISGCIGKNRYQNVSDCLNTILSRNGLKKVEDSKSRLKDLGLLDTVKNISASNHATQSNLVSAIKSAIKKSPGICAAVDDIVIQDMVKEIHMLKGSVNETKSINIYEEKIAQKVSRRNDQLYMKIIDSQTKVCGKIDGMVDGKLIEMKNRQYRFFDIIPEYELVQLHAYMFLTDTLEADLVQHYQGDSKTQNVKFCSDFWDECIEGIKGFSQRYHTSLNLGGYS